MNEINFSKQKPISKTLVKVFEEKYLNPNALLDEHQKKFK